MLLLSGSKGIYLKAACLLGLGKVIKEPFLVGSILEPRLWLGSRTKFLCTEFFPGRLRETGVSEPGNWEKRNGKKMAGKEFPGVGLG